MNRDNRTWADRLIGRVDPSFQHRWILYNNLLTKYLSPDTVWLDCGAGDNGSVIEFGAVAKGAVGIDIQMPSDRVGNFVQADIKHLPFSPEYFNLITLRFVAEHLANPRAYISEITRVLKPGGRIIILTTNRKSPLISIPAKLLLPSLKQSLVSWLFRVPREAVLPTYHRLNTRTTIHHVSENLSVEYFDFISDLNYTRKVIFCVLLTWHALTGLLCLSSLRTNIITVLTKYD